MAENYREYILNEVNEPANWSAREYDLFKTIIDKLCDEDETLVTTEHTHNKLVARDGAPDPAAQCDDDGNLIVGNGLAAADSLAHIHKASAGAAAARAGSLLTLESNASAYLQFLAPTASTTGITFGSPAGAIDGYVTYQPTTHRMDFGCDGLYLMRLRKDDGYIQISNGYPIQAGGASGLGLHNDSGDGCTVNDDGDLQMDTGEYFRLGHDAVSETDVTPVSVYGPTSLSMYVPVKQDDGSLFWCLGTTSEPA